MAKSRSIATNLSRVFDGSPAIIYVINSDGCVSFANEACLNWLGLEFADLKNTRSLYTTHDLENEVESKLKGLGPPPEFANCEELTSQHFAVFKQSPDSNLVWRNALATTIPGDDGAAQSLMVISTGSDSKEKPTLSSYHESTLPSELHLALASLKEEDRLRHTMYNLIGTSKVAEMLKRKIKPAMEAQIELLIVGPKGCGREHLARTAFHHSNTERGRLVPLHCAVADQQLVQQNIKELFANNATSSSSKEKDCLLLLDVDKLSALAQAELLGFMKLPEFSMWTIATAMESLEALEGFDTQLANFLTTMKIEIPPLSSRAEDIPLMAQYFLEGINRDNGNEPQKTGFDEEAMQHLIQYNWPENIDQLIETVSSAAQASSGSTIGLEDLPAQIKQGVAALRVGKAVETSIQLDDYLASIEKQLIERAWVAAKGNKTKTASLLGINRPKLLRRLKQLEIEEQGGDDDTELLDSSAFKDIE